jgi:hypothetical protein
MIVCHAARRRFTAGSDSSSRWRNIKVESGLPLVVKKDDIGRSVDHAFTLQRDNHHRRLFFISTVFIAIRDSLYSRYLAFVEANDR